MVKYAKKIARVHLWKVAIGIISISIGKQKESQKDANMAAVMNGSARGPT